MAIKKINTDLQIEAGLLDGDGNSGVNNQILISTGTGVDWVNASASSIIGGPYLPLSAGSSYPLTGDLTITQSSGNNILFINSSGGGNPVIYMQDSTSKWGQFVSSGDLYFKNETTNVNTLILNGSNATFTGDVDVNGGQLKIKGNFAKLLFEDTAGTDEDAYIVNNGNGLFFGKTNTPSPPNDILSLDLSNNEATFAGDVTVAGKVTAQEFHTEFVSASILYESGSTKFGDTSDDVHSFTGSLNVNGQIKIPLASGNGLYLDGYTAAATPTITNGANNTIVYSTSGGNSSTGAAHKFINHSGTSFLSIHNNGKVGIGTTSPSDELHVEGVIQSKNYLLPSTSGTAGWYKIGTLEGFVQGGATAVIEIAGHQGYNASNTQDYLIKLFIKTSNGNGGGPNGQGFNSWYERTGGNASTDIQFKWDNSATNDYHLYMFIPTHSLRSWYSVKKGTGTWDHVGTSATDPGVNSSSVLKATGLFNILDANVGIGTASPGYKLEVAGTARITSALTFGGNVNNIITGTGSSLDFKSNGEYYFRKGANTNLTILSGGNVGIGTTSPGVKLDLFDTAVNTMRVGSNDNARIIINSNANASTTKESSQLSFADAGSIKWTLYKETNNDLYLYNVAVNKYPIHAKADGDIVLMEDGNNLGVGVSSPSYKLDVSGTIRGTGTTSRLILDNTQGQSFQIYAWSSGVNIYNNSSTNPNVYFGRDAGTANNFYFTRNGTDFTMKVDTANERVGIGTTTPLGKLHVYNTATTSNGNGTASETASGQDSITLYGHGGTNGQTYGSITWMGGARRRAMISAVAENADTDYIGLAFYTQGVDGSGNYSESMRISRSGNVGIGTVSPTAKLQVQGNSFFTNDIFTLQNKGIFFNGVSDFSSGIAGADSGTSVRIFAGGSEKVRVKSTGNVGIGTTSPDFKLDVDGTFGVSGIPLNTDSTFALVADEILGSQLIPNGNFATNSNWNLGAGQWTITGGAAVASNAGNILHTAAAVASSTGVVHKVIFTLSDVTGGYVKVGLSNLENTQYNTNGTYTVYTESSGNNYLYFHPYGFTGKVSNVSTYEVVNNQIQKRELGTGAFGPTPVGAYLPLTAGSSQPLTGALYVGSHLIVQQDATNDLIKSTGNVLYHKANEYSFQDNSNNAWVTVKSGKVGIGATSPGSKLEVNGITTSLGFRTSATNTNYSLISRDSAGNAPLYVQSANNGTNQWIARFNYGGATANSGDNVLTVAKDDSYFINTDVGIGTTGPGARLHVSGDQYENFIVQSTASGYAPASVILQAGNSTARGSGVYMHNTINDKIWYTGTLYNDNTQAWNICYNGDASAVNGGRTAIAQSTHSLLTVKSDGKVGIGTDTPSFKLDTRGSVRILSSDENTLYLDTESTGQQVGVFYRENGAYRWEQRVGSNFELYNYATSSWDFHIKGSTGDVGIGTTTPSAKLDIEGDLQVKGVNISNQENLDVDTGTETIATVVKANYDAAFFDFVIKNGTNLRAGTVFAIHDGTNVEFTETSTNDLGNTSDVKLSVDISGTDMRLRATTTTDNWVIKSLVRTI